MASLGCMLQSLTDQFVAYQRDHPVAQGRPLVPEQSGEASAAMLTEVMMLVRRLQADLDDLRAGLRTEVRTRSMVIEDDTSRVAIAPGEITVQRHATPGEIHSGSFVHIQALIRGAEMQVGAAFQDREDPGVATLINANWEGPNPCATVCAYSEPEVGAAHYEELHVEDRSVQVPDVVAIRSSTAAQRHRQRVIEGGDGMAEGVA